MNGTVDANNVIANGQGGFNVTGSDASNVYYYTVNAPDSSNDSNGTCFGNCASDYSQESLGRVGSMIVAGNLGDFMNWLPKNGTPNNPGAQFPLKFPFKSSTNHYCGPNGAGAPAGANDWACAVHDYNYNKLGAAGQTYAAWTGVGSHSILENGVLKDANRNLVNNVDNSPEGLIIKAVFAIRIY